MDFTDGVRTECIEASNIEAGIICDGIPMLPLPNRTFP